MKLSVSYTYRSEAPRTHMPYNGLPFEAQNKPQLSRQERNADSKVDSITERKPAKMGDTRRQSGMKRKPSNRSKSRTTSCLTNTNEPWYNNTITKLRTQTHLSI